MNKELDPMNGESVSPSDNLELILSGMYPQRPPDEISRLIAISPAAVGETLNAAMARYILDQKERRGLNRAKQLKPGAEILRRWLADEPVHRIAVEMDKQEGSVSMTLDSLAKSLGAWIEMEELSAQAQAVAEQRARGIGEAAAALAAAAEPEPEAVSEETTVSEAVIEEPPQLQSPLQELEPSPETESRQAPESEPQSAADSWIDLDNPVYPLAGRLSEQSRASLDEMIRGAGIPATSRSPRKPDQRRR